MQTDYAYRQEADLFFKSTSAEEPAPKEEGEEIQSAAWAASIPLHPACPMAAGRKVVALALGLVCWLRTGEAWERWASTGVRSKWESASSQQSSTQGNQGWHSLAHLVGGDAEWIPYTYPCLHRLLPEKRRGKCQLCSKLCRWVSSGVGAFPSEGLGRNVSLLPWLQRAHYGISLLCLIQ